MALVRVPPIVFFACAAFLMDALFYNSILTDAFFADTEFGASQWLQGLLGASAAIGYAGGCLLFGPMSERWGRRAPILTAIAGISVCLCFLPRCESFEALIALATAKRCILAMFWPALEAWLADSSRPKNLTRNLGVFNISWTLGIMTGSFVAGHPGILMAEAGTRFGAGAPYGISLAAAAILFGWIWIFDPGPKASAQRAPLIEAKPSQRLFLMQGWMAHLAAFASMSLVMFMLPRLAALPENALSLDSQSTIHSLRVAISLVAFVAMMATQRWHFRSYPVYIGMAFAAVGLILMGAGSGYGPILIGSLFLGLSMGTVYSVSIHYSLGLPRRKGRGSGIHEAMVGIGSAVGPILGGSASLLFDSVRAPFFAGLAPVLVAVVVAAILQNRVRAARVRNSNEEGTKETS